MSPLASRRTLLTRSAEAAAALALAPGLEWLPPQPRAAQPLSVALIGVGRQGRAILAELSKFEDVRVAALCDVSESRLKAGLRRTPLAKGYASHGELLGAEPGVQALIVATPTDVHRVCAVDGLNAKKHVFVECPLAHSLEDALAIREAARASGSVCAVGMQGRSNPIYLLARSFLRSGAIRSVLGLRAQYHKKTSWRQPAADSAEEPALNWQLDPARSLGLLGEFGIQQFDVAHWMLDEYPLAARASGGVLLHADGRKVHDTVHCELEFSQGRRLQWEATLANGFEGQYELFWGEMGAIKLAWNAGWMFKEADAPTQGWEVYANRQQFHDEQGITLIADATKLAAQEKLKEGVGLPNPPLYYALADFLRSIWEGTPVACTVDEGLRAAVVGIQAHRSLLSGERVTIDPQSLKG
jgi:predicted dehydrogenase